MWLKLSLKTHSDEADNLIKYCFAMWPNTKSSDMLLFLQVWSLQGLKLTPEQRRIFLEKVLSPETISRRRRKIQEKAREKLQKAYLPRPEVMAKRLKKDQDLRKYYRQE